MTTSQISHILKYWGLGLQHIFLDDIIRHITTGNYNYVIMEDSKNACFFYLTLIGFKSILLNNIYMKNCWDYNI